MPHVYVSHFMCHIVSVKACIYVTLMEYALQMKASPKVSVPVSLLAQDPDPFLKLYRPLSPIQPRLIHHFWIRQRGMGARPPAAAQAGEGSVTGFLF